MSKHTGDDRRQPKKNAPLSPAPQEDAQETELDLESTQLHTSVGSGAPAPAKGHTSRIPAPVSSRKSSGKKKSAGAPRPSSIFKPRTKNPNFALSVAISTVRLSVILALCAGLAVFGALVGIAVCILIV